MVNSKLFLRGVPTTADVNLLWERIVPELGTGIALSAIAEMIGVPLTGSRLKSVLAPYRKKLFRERAVQTKIEGRVLHFLTHDEVVDGMTGRMIRVGRAAGRVVRDTAAVRPAGTHQRRAADAARPSRAGIDEASGGLAFGG